MNNTFILYAMVGSLLAECVAARNFLCRNQKLPARYRRVSFYIVRATIALGAGVLPVVFNVETASTAFALGIGAPLVINQISRRFSEN